MNSHIEFDIINSKIPIDLVIPIPLDKVATDFNFDTIFPYIKAQVVLLGKQCKLTDYYLVYIEYNDMYAHYKIQLHDCVFIMHQINEDAELRGGVHYEGIFSNVKKFRIRLHRMI